MKLLSAALLGSALLTGQALACDMPTQKPLIPDGTKANEAEMLESQKAVKAYIADMDGYRECLGVDIDSIAAAIGELKSEDDKTTLEIKKEELLRLDDAAVDSSKEVGGAFNVQLRAYLAKQKK
ncbi:MAG: hypothetical protein ACPG6R_01855 [Aequoribacter sp.]|uniref:hypothetical protein n=1 Tax=Aequoribacter sp. TaxID=2847771 RepID=UPI003C4386B9